MAALPGQSSKRSPIPDGAEWVYEPALPKVERGPVENFMTSGVQATGG